MIKVNFKKDWRMQKPLLISYFVIALILFILVTGSYALLRYVELSEQPRLIVNSIWLLVVSLVTLISSILPYVLMFKILKSDLGKHKIHYTIFTPQKVSSWFIPKIIYVFIVQGLFAFISLGYAYYIIDIANKLNPNQGQQTFNVSENILAFLTSTFALAIFGIIALSLALYYSFRKKAIAWILIIITIILYLVLQATSQITITVQEDNGVEFTQTVKLLISYGMDLAIGLITLALAVTLFNKKIEY